MCTAVIKNDFYTLTLYTIKCTITLYSGINISDLEALLGADATVLGTYTVLIAHHAPLSHPGRWVALSETVLRIAYSMVGAHISQLSNYSNVQMPIEAAPLGVYKFQHVQGGTIVVPIYRYALVIIFSPQWDCIIYKQQRNMKFM